MIICANALHINALKQTVIYLYVRNILRKILCEKSVHKVVYKDVSATRGAYEEIGVAVKQVSALFVFISHHDMYSVFGANRAYLTDLHLEERFYYLLRVIIGTL